MLMEGETGYEYLGTQYSSQFFCDFKNNSISGSHCLFTVNIGQILLFPFCKVKNRGLES